MHRQRSGTLVAVSALDIAKVVGTLIATFGGPALLVPLLRAAFPNQRDRLRTELERDADLFTKLPEDGKSREVLLMSIDDDVQRLLELRGARRDPGGIVLGLMFIAFGVVGGVVAWQLGGWLGALVGLGAVLLGSLGLFGFVQDAQHTIRDEKGIPEKPAAARADQTDAPSAEPAKPPNPRNTPGTGSGV